MTASARPPARATRPAACGSCASARSTSARSCASRRPTAREAARAWCSRSRRRRSTPSPPRRGWGLAPIPSRGLARQPADMERTEAGVLLLDADPDLGAGLSEGEFAVARRYLRARVRVLERGPCDPSGGAESQGRLGLLVLEGLLTRDVSVRG